MLSIITVSNKYNTSFNKKKTLFYGCFNCSSLLGRVFKNSLTFNDKIGCERLSLYVSRTKK